MAPKSKSIFRQPGAQHFQLVHRSLRDPLINDPEASQHVLKAFERENVKKGKSRADLESILPPSDVEHDQKAHVGEASLYGIYYDDTEYDYLQHLRPVGQQEDGVESVLVEAPSTSKSKPKSKDAPSITLRDISIPASALPSTSELPQSYVFESQQAVPSSIAGFQPDMDPHLRQVLEALEDEAFVDDGLEDDFFGELVGGGERASDEEIQFEFQEDGLEGRDEDEEDDEQDDDTWESRFAQFKKVQKSQNTEDGNSDDGFNSEGGDTVGQLPEMSVIGGKGKKRRKGTSDASGYSMSSSSMFRNEALQTLDERFDQMILKEYQEDDDEDSASELSDDDDAPELITTREDFESMMDDFLDNYEILGRKMRQKLEGDSGMEKLDTLRRTMGLDERVRVTEEGDESDDDILMPIDVDDKKDRWDCETILSTYSNLENHPRLIIARDPRPVPKIMIDPKTGMPIVGDGLQEKSKRKLKGRKQVEVILEEEDEDEDEEDDDLPTRTTISRPRDESADAKKARKAAVKAERQARRADKKATKEIFAGELKNQMKGIQNKEKVKMRKL